MFAMRIPRQPPSHVPSAAPGRAFSRAGARVHYRDEGSGPALVLVHGWPLDLDMWAPQVAGLAKRFRILRMDRRGFGRSTGTPSLAADSLDLRAFLDRSRVARVALLGMSQGARVALDVASSGDDRIACLILDGAPADVRLADRQWEEEIPLAQYRRILEDRGIEALRREMVTHPFLRLQTRARAVQRLLATMIERYDAADLKASVVRAAPVASRPLAQLAMPVLILNGEHDTPQRLRIGEALHEAIPAAERRLVPRAGHLANLDNATEYNVLLGRFLERHLATPA